MYFFHFIDKKNQENSKQKQKKNEANPDFNVNVKWEKYFC